MPMYPNDPRFWYAGIGLVVGMSVFVLVYDVSFEEREHIMAPDPTYRAQRASRGVPTPALKVWLRHDVPCSPERIERDLELWHEAGWALAELTPDRALADLVVSGDESTLPPTRIGAPRLVAATGFLCSARNEADDACARWDLTVVLRSEDRTGPGGEPDGKPDVCDLDNLVIAHELGHGVYGLEHPNRDGTVMTESTGAADWLFPAPPQVTP